MWTISYSDYCVLSAFRSDPDQYSNYQWNGKQEERQVIEQINSILDPPGLEMLVGIPTALSGRKLSIWGFQSLEVSRMKRDA